MTCQRHAKLQKIIPDMPIYVTFGMSFYLILPNYVPFMITILILKIYECRTINDPKTFIIAKTTRAYQKIK